MADLTNLYRANWRIAGLSKKELVAGDTVKLSDEDAAPLVTCGALSLADDKSVKSQPGE